MFSLLPGKQVCVGEDLTSAEFLFLTTILQSFSLEALVETKEIDQTHCYWFTNIPPPYQLCLIPRLKKKFAFLTIPIKVITFPPSLEISNFSF
jgi:hypothetical protein